MLWSIDTCQNKVSADQYHVTISQAQVGPYRGQLFFLSSPLTRELLLIGSQAQGRAFASFPILPTVSWEITKTLCVPEVISM